MTKPGDSRTKKTIYELVKEFPNKTYNELEKYRNADRNEEAQQIITQQENEELKDNQIKESWKDKYDLEHRLRREAEGETTIVKGIGMNSPEMKALEKRVKELDNSLSIALSINDTLQRESKKLNEDLTKAKEDHQFDNLVHKKELEERNKK